MMEEEAIALQTLTNNMYH